MGRKSGKGLLEIRDSVRSLIEYQTNDYPDEVISTEQENLNRLYDAFTQKYGLINNRGNYLAFAADESYFLLCSLEVLDDEGNFKRKSFIKSYSAVCLEGAVIVLACIIFSLFASSPPVVNPDAAAVTMVWSYIGELVFNMLVLVGAVKMADRVVREMMGL